MAEILLKSGKRAIFYSFPCHPTVLSAGNLLVSADFAGQIEKHLHGDFTVFANGAAGDISTRFTRQESSFEECERMGKLAADYILTLLEQAEEVCCEETMERIDRADCVVLPLPATDGNGVLNTPFSGTPHTVKDLLEYMEPGQLVCAGMVKSDLRELAEKRSLLLCDYFAREELAVANAAVTAEGALQVAMEELPVTLYGSRALILGYGRIGRILAQRLRGLGAFVSAAARRQEQLAWAEVDGCVPCRLQELEGILGDFDVIFNTVPSLILTEKLLRKLKQGCAVIDLASAPGGVDFEGAKELGISVIWARALPGKVAPETAARIIRQTIYHILEEVPE